MNLSFANVLLNGCKLGQYTNKLGQLIELFENPNNVDGYIIALCRDLNQLCYTCYHDVDSCIDDEYDKIIFYDNQSFMYIDYLSYIDWKVLEPIYNKLKDEYLSDAKINKSTFCISITHKNRFGSILLEKINKAIEGANCFYCIDCTYDKILETTTIEMRIQVERDLL